ncbi:hypothetical protein [Methylocystis bryophila]|uniref:Lectin-like protein BA14k n=1 Tax=Methylocystis bryophila TaxID=655015 RepID=A0A1W6MV62_9HYPH|nr:hypothetical protein [Methylocystis bryophila]ARN81457.1 hypothetical protein B1812_10665 [Methylocystis bryophila]BDV37466.1 hypothetical protein DSM21852_07190 [Methylocystis bryophila]
MISKRAKIFAVATLSTLLLASPALAGGWGYGPRWGYGHGYGGGYGWGAAAAAGALGGLAVGLIASQAAAYPAPYPYYYGPRCGVVNEPLYDSYGYVAGYRPTRVCE